MITVLLLDRNQQEVATVNVHPQCIVEAACIVYQGRYFIYNGMEGRFFTSIKFGEVNAPVDITDIAEVVNPK